MSTILKLSTLGIWALSTNALFMLGINYGGSGGSPFDKLHPAFYLLLLGLLLSLVSHRRAKALRPLSFASSHALVMILAAMVMIVWAVVSPNAGGELSGPIISFLMPALLLLLLTRSTAPTLDWIAWFIPLFLLANSLFALVSYATGIRLLAHMAGALVVQDPRPTALLGHPLVNAQITGAYLLFVLSHSIATRFTPRRIFEVALHALALLAFGGRSALALVVVIGTIYAIFKLYQGLATTKLSSLVSLTILLFALLVALPLAIEAGLANVLLERLSDDGGSADTRLAAIKMLGTLDFQQWILGAGPAQRNQIQLELQTPFGVENFMVALIVTHGLPVTALIVAASFAALFKLASPLGGPGASVVIFYFLSSLTSLSLGSKTTTLSMLICMIVAFQRQREFASGRSPFVTDATRPSAV